MRVYGVDPGARSTGVVLVEDGEVIWSETIRYGGPIARQSEVQEMVLDVADRLEGLLDSSGYDAGSDVLVVEGFEYMGNFHADSLKTVFLVGALMDRFPGAVWQTSAQVLNHRRVGNHAHIKDRPDRVPGGSRCSNDHERSALAHAIHYIDTTRQGSLF